MKIQQAQPILIKTLIAVGGFLGAYYLGTCGHGPSKYEQEVATWKERANSALVQNQATTRFADSLQKQVAATEHLTQQQTVEIARLKQDVAKAHVPKGRVDSTIAQAPDTCKKVVEVAKELQAENGALNAVIVAQDARDSARVITIGLLHVEVDTLRKQNTTLNDKIAEMVKTVPVHKEPKLLGFIPYPSRVASFLVGGAIGIGSTIAVIAAVK
jgi:hypothetical protein